MCTPQQLTACAPGSQLTPRLAKDYCVLPHAAGNLYAVPHTPRQLTVCAPGSQLTLRVASTLRSPLCAISQNCFHRPKQRCRCPHFNTLYHYKRGLSCVTRSNTSTHCLTSIVLRKCRGSFLLRRALRWRQQAVLDAPRRQQTTCRAHIKPLYRYTVLKIQSDFG